MSFKRLALILFVIIVSQQLVVAQEVPKKQSPLRFLIDGALEFGGDELAEVQFTNGKTQSTKAGQGGSLAVGGEFQLPKAEKFALRAALGFKYVTTMADNAHIRLTRLPVYLTANFMAVKKLRLGAGIVNHQIIRYKADGFGEDLDLTGSTGPMFEVAFHGVALRYTSMKYKDQDNFNYSANSIGVSFSTTIPGR